LRKAFKYELCPDGETKKMLAKNFGCVRFAYNHFLDLRQTAYATDKTSLSFVDCANMLPALKVEFPWLKEVDAISLQQVLKDLDQAYKNFFNGSGYPKFKTKHDHNHSYRTQVINGNILISENMIRLPKLGWVKFRNSRPIEGEIKSVTVSRTNTDKYFVSVLCEVAQPIPLPRIDKVVGIDVGIKDFCVTSDLEHIENPRHLRKLEKKLTSAQKDFSRKKKASKNSRKARLKLAKIHERIANQRKDFLHKLSTRLVRENQAIHVEDLDIKEMMQTHYLAKDISDCSWSEFNRLLEYKSLWYGRTFTKVDRYFPSSQICNECDYQNPAVKDLSVRTWVCPQCGADHDRDENSAENIKKEGQRLLAAS